MNQEAVDQEYMSRALQIAKLGGVHVAPNPLVGAVIVHQNKIIGEGYHHKYGAPHAEVNAINNVKDKSVLSDATIYITLEPCAHQGKTPPCTDLIIKHGLKRVVVACLDVNPKVSGSGIAQLKKNNIKVRTGVLEEKANYINRRFFTFHQKKRPFVILKWAETRDGFIDPLQKNRKDGINWITQPRIKLFVHQWRSLEQSIMVGWKTINNDNPQLNVRKIDGRSPHRFIIDPNGQSNLNAKVFTDGGPTTVICREDISPQFPEHVEVIHLSKFSTTAILSVLYRRNILSVFVEGGAQTIQHFIDERTWDEVYQLIGNVNFYEGLKAPQLINSRLINQETIAGDIIQHREQI